MEDDYLDPIVAAIVGDNSGLLTTITESQAAMSEFAASAPAMGQFGPQPGGGAAEEAAAAMSAGVAAAAAAAAPSAEDFAPLIEAAGEAGHDAGVELGRNLTEAEVAALSDQDFETLFSHLQATAAEAGRQAGTDLGRSLSEAEVAALSDDEFEAYVTRLRETAQEASQAVEANAAAGGAAMAERWAQWAAEAEEAGAEAEAAGAEIEDLGNKTADAGQKAAGAQANWMLLGAGFAAVAAGPMVLSAAIVGVGYEIANFGGEARGQLQVVREAFQSSAAEAAQAYEPAIQNITAGLVGMVHQVEPQMAQMFTELRGPAESFFQGLESSVERGMSAMVPAVQAMGPVISQVSEDLGPLVQGVAGFVQEMAAAFTANGGNQWLAQFADDMGRLMPVVGELVGELGAGFLPVLDASANVLRIVGDVLAGLGSPIDTVIIGGIGIARIWTTVTSGMEGAVTAYNKTIEAVQSINGWISTHIGLTEADATATSAAAVATGEMAAATEAEGIAAEASVAGSAAAAAGIESTGVAADEAAVSLATFIAELAPFLLIGVAGWEVGTAIGHSLAGGMDSSQSQVTQSAYNLGTAVQTGFSSALQMASPSRVMTDAGENVATSVGLGIGNGAPTANAASAALAQSMTQAFSTGVSGGGGGYGPPSGGGGGGGGNTYNITLHIEAPLASASASEIAAAVIPALQDANLLNGQSMASHNGIKGGAGR